MKNNVSIFRKSDSGSVLVEYAILITIIIIGLMVGFTLFSKNNKDSFRSISKDLSDHTYMREYESHMRYNYEDMVQSAMWTYASQFGLTADQAREIAADVTSGLLEESQENFGLVQDYIGSDDPFYYRVDDGAVYFIAESAEDLSHQRFWYNPVLGLAYQRDTGAIYSTQDLFGSTEGYTPDNMGSLLTQPPLGGFINLRAGGF